MTGLHNARLPHAALRGQTPDEMFLGTGKHIAEALGAARKAARQSRRAENCKKTCPNCEQLPAIPHGAEPADCEKTGARSAVP